jgi:5-(carboxyamino)imidazole ribonucleotide mutase
MRHASKILKTFDVNHEVKIISAHRTPKRMFNFAEEAQNRGIKIIIAGAGGAAHLPGMTASISNLPVLGVPIESKKLKGLDSLLSIVQMPAGIPVGSLAVGDAGAINAALLAISILSNENISLRKKYKIWRNKQTKSIKKKLN